MLKNGIEEISNLLKATHLDSFFETPDFIKETGIVGKLQFSRRFCLKAKGPYSMTLIDKNDHDHF